MKTSRRTLAAGYALLMVLFITVASVVILAGTINRTYTVSRLNDRNYQYNATFHAAEAAVEKAYARMAYDFSAAGVGLSGVSNNANSVNHLYQTAIPNETAAGGYWNNFVFSDAQGHDNQINVFKLTNYSGNLPSQFGIGGQFRATKNAPIYRIVANARMSNGRAIITNAVQEDILLALVPISNDALFSSGLMEFTWCAPFDVNGFVHANGDIYTGCSSSSHLTFNGQVTTVSNVSSPSWGGHTTNQYTGLVSFPGGKTIGVPPVQLSLNMTNTHSLIDMPPAGEVSDSAQGQQRLYNQAQVVLLISNNYVMARIQNGTLPGADGSPTTIVVTNNVTTINSTFPFLVLTNTFLDQRENKTIKVSQIDLGKYKSWLSTNSAISAKFPAGSGTYPTILFLADNRTTGGSELTAVRITNGIAPPSNGSLGFSLATPNPLYVWGNYNCTNASYLSTTNTSATVPSALMSDALTLLSSTWKDSLSSTNFTSRDATNTTINAAILTGLVYSTGPGTGQFSGGMMNLTRLLEDWTSGSATLTLNTSLLSLFASTKATMQFQDPGAYYYAPSRKFSFDCNFYDPNRQPPGMPCALMPVRFNFAVPPPNTISYNVTP